MRRTVGRVLIAAVLLVAAVASVSALVGGQPLLLGYLLLRATSAVINTIADLTYTVLTWLSQLTQ